MSVFQIPVIETERLILRPLSVDDAEDVFKWTGDPRVAEFMIYSTHESVEVSKEWLRSLDTLENEYSWGFVRKSDGMLIGSGSIRLRPDEGRWSFGYNIRRDCWNNGYTTEAAQRMIRFVRETHGADRFVSEHAVDNPASGRVMEKCGLHFTGDYGQCTSFDGKKTFKTKIYELNGGDNA